MPWRARAGGAAQAAGFDKHGKRREIGKALKQLITMHAVRPRPGGGGQGGTATENPEVSSAAQPASARERSNERRSRRA
jgi:hypothetical protein